MGLIASCTERPLCSSLPKEPWIFFVKALSLSMFAYKTSTSALSSACAARCVDAIVMGCECAAVGELRNAHLRAGKEKSGIRRPYKLSRI